MYIYMGKRKPKLCRMKRLDVSQKITFFFLLKMNQFILSPSLSTFLLTEKMVSEITMSHFLVGVGTIALCRVEERHAQFVVRTSNQLDHLLFVLRRPVAVAHTHAAQP